MEILKAGIVLACALSMTGCVWGVTDYYEDDGYPRPQTVYVTPPPAVVVERPVVVRQRPVVVHEAVAVRRPVVVREDAVVVRERPRQHVIVTRPSHSRYREEASFVRPQGRPGHTSTVVSHGYRHEDDSTAVVHPQAHSRNDREESSSVVVHRWDKTRNVAPPSTVAEHPYNNNQSTTVIERQ